MKRERSTGVIQIRLTYGVEMVPSDDRWIARVIGPRTLGEDIDTVPRCVAEGESPQEARDNLASILPDFIHGCVATRNKFYDELTSSPD